MVLDVGLVVPVHGENAIIEFACRIFQQQVSNVDNSQILLPCLWVNPEINTEQAIDGYIAPGFFQYFARAGLLGRLSALNMATRLRDDVNAR